jgi:hypothetical protein
VAAGKLRAAPIDQAVQVFDLVFTPDGKSLITGNLGGVVVQWNLEAFEDATGAGKGVRTGGTAQ